MERREWLSVFLSGSAGWALAPAGRATGDHGPGKTAGGPLAGPHAHFCGIHAAKKDPKFQLVTQHYCAAHTEHGRDDLFQCVLFDTTGKNARLLGVEYIVSDAVYRGLPDGEKKYWHPHTYEVLGGGLIAPGMKPDEELAFMKMILTTWGKAWHTWPDPKSPVPVGEPLLIWSLTGDGQADEAVVAARDREFGCSTAKIREARGQAIGFEVPRVAPPMSMDAVGRQWTDAGDDRPTRRR
jgi:hypothetical protein